MNTSSGTSRTVITKLVAMETKPGTLLKLTADTSNDIFATAAVAGDVSTTCGHLVSLVAANKGIQNTPLALLGNHLKTGLLKIQAATPIDTECKRNYHVILPPCSHRFNMYISYIILTRKNTYTCREVDI